MVVLSRVLPDGANRWANIVAAVVTVAYVWGGMSFAPHYYFFASVQTVACGFIAWSAWSMRPARERSRELVASAH